MWGVDFRDWLALMRRAWLLLLATTVAGVALGTVAAVSQEHTWTSTANLVLSPSAEASDGQDLAYAGQYVLTRMKTYSRLAQSTRVAEAATAALPSGDDGLGTVSAGQEPETTVLTIKVTSTTAKDAQRDLRAVVTAFTEALAQIERGSQHAAAVSADSLGEPSLPAHSDATRPTSSILAGAVLGFLAGLTVALFRHLRKR